MEIKYILNTVIHADCLDIMRELPDKCIDLVLTDPPYGIGEDGKKNHSRSSDRILATKFLIKAWDKVNGYNDFADCELAWTSFNTAVRKVRYMWNGHMQGDAIGSEKQKGNKKLNEKRFHPTQKPVALFRWILQNYSKEGMTIFDPFAGSGTTAITCLEEKRNYILVEKEKGYFDLINNRIEQWKEQGRLF